MPVVFVIEGLPHRFFLGLVPRTRDRGPGPDIAVPGAVGNASSRGRAVQAAGRRMLSHRRQNHADARCALVHSWPGKAETHNDGAVDADDVLVRKSSDAAVETVFRTSFWYPAVPCHGRKRSAQRATRRRDSRCRTAVTSSAVRVARYRPSPGNTPRCVAPWRVWSRNSWASLFTNAANVPSVLGVVLRSRQKRQGSIPRAPTGFASRELSSSSTVVTAKVRPATCPRAATGQSAARSCVVSHLRAFTGTTLEVSLGDG